jgi:ribosomal protein S18 acetylase RimI-like enzyme
MEPGDVTIAIRPLVEAEIPQLWVLWRAAGLPIRPQGRDSLAALSRQRRANPDGFLGAFAGTLLVGSVIASDDGRRGWINRLAVAPEFRHVHLGSRLLVAAETQLHSRGLHIIGAHAHADNHASRALLLYAAYKPMGDVIYFSKRDSDEA